MAFFLLPEILQTLVIFPLLLLGVFAIMMFFDLCHKLWHRRKD